jgi:hypothetical protein
MAGGRFLGDLDHPVAERVGTFDRHDRRRELPEQLDVGTYRLAQRLLVGVADLPLEPAGRPVLGDSQRAHLVEQLYRARPGERIDTDPATHGRERRLRGERRQDRTLGARELLGGALDRREKRVSVLEQGEELEQLVPLLEALGDQPLRGKGESDDVVGAHLALEEEHRARAEGEQRAHDLLDLELDALPDVLGRKEAEVDQIAAEGSRRAIDRLGLTVLLGADDAAPHETLAETIDALVGAREHDLAGVQVDALLGLPVLEVQEAGFRGPVDHAQQVGQGEGPHVGREHEIAIERERGPLAAARSLEQDGARAGGQHARRLVIRETEPLPLCGREIELCRHRCPGVFRHHPAPAAVRIPQLGGPRSLGRRVAAPT